MNDIIYFDNAATSYPKPQSVISGSSRCMREYCGNPGRGSHPLALAASEKLYECREYAAELFCAPSPDNVIFTMNTTYALNTAIKSFISEGSHVLISDLEHNAVLRPVEEMKRRGKIDYDIFPTKGDPAQIVTGIKQRIRKNTKAIVCTLASNICSARIPSKQIGKLCREHGILFIADGAQAAGHREINMTEEGIDVLCLPGHKGLYGPQGIGMMLTSSMLRGDTIIEGGSGSDSASPFMPEYLPDRYEVGTLNTPAAAGLLEGMRYVSNMGLHGISTFEHELWNRVYSRLCGDRRFKVYGDLVPSSVILINKKGRDPSELAGYLAQRGICVRSGLHCAPLAHKTIGTGEGGGVRISFGIFNSLKQVDILCDALYRA